jgi:DNA-binding transcriptional LysR family regulator
VSVLIHAWIRQLESKLGVRLFVRSTRGLTPTEAGQPFYERAKVAVLIARMKKRGLSTATALSGDDQPDVRAETPDQDYLRLT